MRQADRHMVFGIIGRSLDHSLSPTIHNHFFHKAGLNYVYGIFEIPANRLGESICGMKALGIGGANVTDPYKQTVIPCLDGLAQSAAQVRAVNTIKNVRGRLIGYNTDFLGIRAMLFDKLRLKLAGKSVAVLGAGGAARACVSELVRAKVGRLRIINRTPEKAEDMIAGLPLGRHRPRLEVHPLVAEQEQFSDEPPLLIINATSAAPIQLRKIINTWARGKSSDQIILWDLNYGPRSLAPKNVPGPLHYFDGLFMLAAQAAESFRLWTGQRLEHEAVYRFLKKKITGR